VWLQRRRRAPASRELQSPPMVFASRLREGVRRGRIRCTVRIWQSPRVRPGGRYPMDDGHVVVDSIEPIRMKDITSDLARESGFDSLNA
jgi:hypothetical protein